MPPSAEEFEKFVSYWLNLKQSDGFESRQRAYWIARMPATIQSPGGPFSGTCWELDASHRRPPRAATRQMTRRRAA